MGTTIDQVEGKGPLQAVRCPICGRENSPRNECRHVRWTFDRGDPLDFAMFALEASPYVRGRGHQPTDIPKAWWQAHGDWVIEQIDFRLHIGDGYVFGDLNDLDVLARDIWKAFQPDTGRDEIQRTNWL